MKWRLPYVVMGGLIMALNLFFYLTHAGGEGLLAFVSDALPVLCGSIAVIGLAMALSSFGAMDRTKAAWALILLGIGLNALAEAIYAAQELLLGFDMNEFFPSYADPFWLAGYLPILAALLMFFIGYKSSGLPMGGWFKYAAAGLGIALVGASLAALVLVPIFADESAGALAKAAYAFYPIADFLLLIPAVALILVTARFGRGAALAPWILITLGFVGWCASDILYSILSWQGLYGSGNYIDLGWNASYLLLGAAGFSQRSLMRSI
jgi:uncharacterized membrane protein